MKHKHAKPGSPQSRPGSKTEATQALITRTRGLEIAKIFRTRQSWGPRRIPCTIECTDLASVEHNSHDP